MRLKYNFYEELGLSCQKKLKEDEIRAAIEKYISEIRKSHNTASDRSALNAKLNLENEMLAFASDESLQKAHKDDLLAKRKAQIKKLVNMLKSKEADSRPIILLPRIKTLATHFDLETDAVRQSFKDGGFEVGAAKKTVVDGLFIADNIFARLETDLERIRERCKRENDDPNARRMMPGALEFVSDLYDYLAAQNPGNVKDRAQAAAMGTARLKAMFEALVKTPNRNQNEPPFVFYKNLEAQAMTQIFSSEAERKKYDNSLRLLTLRKKTLDFVRELPDQLKRDRSFAENVIQEIQTVFPNEDEAIAIYNKFSGLRQDQHYEKETPEIRIVCSCGRPNIHKSLDQAHIAKCANCGEDLFRRCPSCAKYVFNSSDYCSCGYHLPDASEFAKFRDLCADALKRSDLEAAKKFLDEARLYKPANADISVLEKQLNTLAAQINIDVVAIEDSISKKLLAEATHKLNVLRSKYPAMSFTSLEKKLADSRNAAKAQQGRADRESQKISALPDLKSRIAVLTQILRDCPDHEPSRNLLRGADLRPLAPLALVAEANHHKRTISVSWQPNPRDTSVVYRLVRNEGKNPASPGDGVIVADNMRAVNFVDSAVRAGVQYHYAVFATHKIANIIQENFSPASTVKSPTFLLPGLNPETISYELDGSSCILRWKDEPGSQGVRIERISHGGVRKKISDCASGSLVDNDLCMGNRYLYEFATVWRDASGKMICGPIIARREVIAANRPVALHPRKMAPERQDGLCQISWQCEKDACGDVTIFRLKSHDIMQPGREYDISLLAGMGTTLGAARANAGEATINIGPDNGAFVTLLRQFGNKVIPGNILRLSSLAPVGIGAITLNREEGTLLLTCSGCANAASYEIKARSPNGKAATWRNTGTGSDAVQILCENVPEGELDLEITAITADGFATPPATHKLFNLKKAKVHYSLKWKRQFGLLGPVTELVATGNMESGPVAGRKLYLCSAPSFHGADMQYYNEGRMKMLAEIFPDEGGNFAVAIDISARGRIASGDRVSLVAPQAEMDMYDIACDTPKEMKNPN